MKNRMCLLGLAAPLLAGMLLAFTGCQTEAEDDPFYPIFLDTLAGTVWAGETPRADDWLTMTFKDGKVIWSFAFDNTTNEWDYTYDAGAGTGTVTNPAGGWNPAPDGFSVSADGATLTITHYGSHAGSPRDFKRVRKADYAIVDPVPFTVTNLPSDLINSVWMGATPQDNGHGWLTITFQANSEVIWAFSTDNTTNKWNYTYSDSTKAGTVTVASGWNPAPDGFSINDGQTELTIVHYGNHSGDPRTFKRYR